MASFIVRRIVSMLPVLLIVSFAAFSLIWLVPGDAAVVILGPDVDKATVTVGPKLTMDSKVERFVGDNSEHANWFIRDSYRAPFVIPDAV